MEFVRQRPLLSTPLFRPHAQAPARFTLTARAGIHNPSSASFPSSSIQRNCTWPRHGRCCLQLDWRCCCAQVSSAGAPVTRCRLGFCDWQVAATAGWISRPSEAAQMAVAAADSSHSKPRKSQLAHAPCSRMRVHCISPCCRCRAGCWCQVRVSADVWKALTWQLLDWKACTPQLVQSNSRMCISAAGRHCACTNLTPLRGRPCSPSAHIPCNAVCHAARRLQQIDSQITVVAGGFAKQPVFP